MQASYRQKCKFTTLLPEAVCCCLQTCNRRFVMRVIYFIARKVEKLHKQIVVVYKLVIHVC